MSYWLVRGLDSFIVPRVDNFLDPSEPEEEGIDRHN